MTPQPKVWCDELAELLASKYPDIYSGWTGEMVTKAVKPYGIRSEDVRLKDRDGVWRTKRGITWAALQEAIRDREAGSTPV